MKEGLPKELWLKIYEYILFDIDLRDKINFSLVCRYFDKLSKDSDLLRSIIQRHLPIYMDSPEYQTNPHYCLREIRDIFGFTLPPRGKPTEFAEVLMQEVKDVAFRQCDEELLEGRYKKLRLRRDFTDPRWMEGLEFGKVLEHVAGFNFRALVALFDPSHLTPQGMRGLQWAAALKDLALLKKLMAKKRKLYRFHFENGHTVHPEEDFENNETLKAISTHLETGNIKEIRKCLHVDFDALKVRTQLHGQEFCKRVSTWHYEDIFKTMTVDTFRAFQKLAWRDFQGIMAAPLVRCDRADLIQLSEIYFQFLNDSANLLMMAYERIKEARKKGQTATVLTATATFQALRYNDYFMRGAASDFICIIEWAFQNRLMDLVELCLPYYLQSHSIVGEMPFLMELLEWALENKRQDIIESVKRFICGFPGERSYPQLSEHFGPDHPFTKMAPQPVLKPFVSAPSYLPSFSGAQSQPALGTSRNGEDSTEPSKRVMPG